MKPLNLSSDIKALAEVSAWEPPTIREQPMCDNCDGAPDGGHTHADSCCQREAAEPIYFSCGHCAVEHVLADPAGRETPESVDAPAGTVVRSCPRDGGNPSRH